MTKPKTTILVTAAQERVDAIIPKIRVIKAKNIRTRWRIVFFIIQGSF